jgi:very-short-patch-repair endonuclease
VTAARILGLPLPKRFRIDPRLDVAVDADSPQPRHADIRGHRIVRAGADRPLVVADLPLVPPSRVWLQLAPLLTVDELVVVGDALCRRTDPLLTPDELRRRIVRSPGARGIRRARAALARIRPGTDSPMESVLRLALLRQGLPEPEIGVAVRDDAGGYVGRPDLTYPTARIAIEYEGDVHRIERDTFVRDILRRERFERAGWTVVRVISDHLAGDACDLAARIRILLDAETAD